MLHWLPQFGLSFIMAPFFSYHVKSLLPVKSIISVLILKNMWPVTALCSIKKGLSQKKADNFDPAVREMKGQDRCRGMQNTRFLPTALLLSLYSFSLNSWILPFDYSAVFESAFSFHFSFCLQRDFLCSVLFPFSLFPAFISPPFFFSTASCFVLPLKFALTVW